MKKPFTSFLKIVFSAALIAVLLWELDWAFVKSELTNVEPAFLFLFVLCQFLAMFVSAKKWQSIACFQGAHFSVWAGFKAYLTGTFVNNFLPSTIGGDIYRSLWLVGRGETKTKAFSTVIFDRVNGLGVTLTLAILTFVFVWQQAAPLPSFLAASYGVAAACFFIFISTLFLASPQFVRMLPGKKIEAVVKEIAEYRKARVWTEASLWSALFIILGLGVSNYLLFLALGYTLPFLPFVGLIVMMALYVSIPLSINNIGVKEWAYGVLFVLLGVSFDTAVTVALMSRVLQIGISLLALPLYFFEKKMFTAPLQAARDSDTL